MSQLQYATKRLIDSVWTVAYTVDNGVATIRGYGRHCNHGYANERRLDRCTLVEDDGRTVKQLVVQPHQSFRYGARPSDDNATTYDVANPGHVFGYGDPPEPGSEAS